MSILKIEAFSGLSGDMFLGALAELSGAYDELQQLPSKLKLNNVEINITNVEKAGIACKHIKVVDHNEYNGGMGDQAQERERTHSHAHNHEPDHAHEHQHTHHRHIKDIEKIIDQGDLTSGAKSIAREIFFLLGSAESKVHGIDISKVHFHEVGAIDSIVDVVGSAYLLDKIGVGPAFSTSICTGHGFVMTEHGRLPVPAPATKELLLGFPTYSGKEKGEMTTPTGAAILKYLEPSFDIPVLIEEKTGHGPGEKDFEHPNILRLSLCRSTSDRGDEVHMVETNIDDMSPELLGNDFQEGLLNAGALDFYFTQIMMKKGRPGVLVSVFSDKKNVNDVKNYLLENTSTIGVRSYSASRQVLGRSTKTIQTSIGKVEIKEVDLPSGSKRVTLEYESCKRLARELGRPISEIFSIINKEL